PTGAPSKAPAWRATRFSGGLDSCADDPNIQNGKIAPRRQGEGEEQESCYFGNLTGFREVPLAEVICSPPHRSPSFPPLPPAGEGARRAGEGVLTLRPDEVRLRHFPG